MPMFVIILTHSPYSFTFSLSGTKCFPLFDAFSFTFLFYALSTEFSRHQVKVGSDQFRTER